MTRTIAPSKLGASITPKFILETIISGRVIVQSGCFLALTAGSGMAPRQVPGITVLSASKNHHFSCTFRLNPSLGKGIGKITPGKSLTTTNTNTPTSRLGNRLRQCGKALSSF